MSSVRGIFLGVLAGLALWTAVPAGAEISQEGTLIIAFEGDLTPNILPRRRPVPVAVRVAGDIKSTARAQLPQLRTISVAINSAGRLYDRGLPTCNVEAIQPATEVQAKAVCGRSIVGSGHVTLQARIEGQPSFTVKASLLAFNGPRRAGRKLILAQVYSEDPLGAFVLTFKVSHRDGLFGTVMSTSLPPSARGWVYLTHFDMTLKRQYYYRGRVRSYVSAACAAPAGFPGAVFPFARASYGFDNGQRLSKTVVRTCRVG